MKDTKIEWADNTVNFYIGCSKVSEGCSKCYMFRLENRFGRDPTKIRSTNWDTIRRNLSKWTPSTIFVNSMSDSFHESLSDNQILEMFHVMTLYPQHNYIILTKRIKRAAEFLNGVKVHDNFWIGTSVENDKYLWRIDELRKIDAKVRFVSFEPLLGYVNDLNLNGIQWVIVGGESDPNPRVMQGGFVLGIFDECKARGIPFFFKQWGGSKKCDCHGAWGCRLFDGQEYNEMPNQVIVQHTKKGKRSL